MAVPQPVGLAGADEPPDDPVGTQQSGVPDGELQPVTEQRLGRRLLSVDGRPRRVRCGSGRHQAVGRTTIRRLGSTPSDSLSTPASALITSWTHLRSNADIGSRRTGSPYSLTFSAAFFAIAANSLRRDARYPPTSSRSRLGVPVCRKIAS